MQTHDWRARNEWIADLLKRRTGDDVETWNTRIREAGLPNEASLRRWLACQGVTGYPRSRGLAAASVRGKRLKDRYHADHDE